MGQMFNETNMAKLMAHPKVGKYFADPGFKNMIEFCKMQPNMFFQLMQSDPRFMEVFQVVTGIDLDAMGGAGGKGGPKKGGFPNPKKEESHEHEHGENCSHDHGDPA